MMNDPRISAVLSGLCALYFGCLIFGSDETPSTLMSAFNWFFFVVGLVGLLGAVMTLSRGRRP
jgi:uncharacterized membrane protein